MLAIKARKNHAGFEWRGELELGFGVTALFGPSGAGKTTLVNMVAGLVAPDEGEIRIGQNCVFSSAQGINLAPERRSVGVVFQDGRLFPHLSVRRNLTYGRRRSAQPLSSLDEVVERLELGALLDRRPMSLSGGEQQRVAIGRALLTDPEVLLLDEPLAGLDGARRSEVLDMLTRLGQNENRVLLYVTHQMREVLRLADRLALIDAGRIKAVGSPQELLGRPELQRLTGRHSAGALLICRMERSNDGDGLSRLSCCGQRLLVPRLERNLPQGSEVVLKVRAGDVALSREAQQQSSALNVVSGVVERVLEEDEAFSNVVVDIGQTLWARITRRSARELNFAAGQRVYATIKTASLVSEY
ncbi:molybdenum ABC transporter ATP-binding protein [Candidatus Foliamicus sp.]